MNSRDPQILRRKQKKSADEIDIGLLTKVITATSVLVVVLALIGQIELMIGVIVAVAAGVAWWALRLQEPSHDRATRIRELRRLVRLSKLQDEDSESSGKPPPVVVLGIAATVGAFCVLNLTSSWKQFRAMDLPVVEGRITRHEMVDVDLGSQLKVEYSYRVDGKIYHGNRLRFVYRAYRVGTDDAKQLAATWRLGNRVSVFYEPDKPAVAVLDNTFCKGDQLQVGLNAIAVILSLVVMSGAGYVELRSRTNEIRVEHTHGVFIVPLCNVPLLGTLATMIATGSLMLTFIALLAGFIAMGDAEIPWLVTTIDWLYIVTTGLSCVAGMIYAVERVSFGVTGRKVTIDARRRTISWPPETIGQTVSIDATQITSLRVASNREDCFRLARTFSVVASYVDRSGEIQRKVIQRSYGRRYAVALASAIKSVIADEMLGDTVTEEPRESRDAELTPSADGIGLAVSAQQEVLSE